jgi:DNA-binding NarL/FixJ family response regulator
VASIASGDGFYPVARARVLTVDDHDPFLGALRILVRRTELLRLVGEAASGEHALEVAEHCRPEFILMDVHMPGMGGVAATPALKDRHPSAVVALISTMPPEELSQQALACGAEEILWKSNLRPALLDAIWLRHRPPPTP